jgi:hypothetical protein
VQITDVEDGEAAFNCSTRYKLQYHIFVIEVSSSHVHFGQVSRWHRFKYFIHIPQVTTQMYNIYIVHHTLEFLISALRTCVVSAFPPCNAVGMNQTLIQIKMPHVVLYASLSHSPTHKRVWNRAFGHIRLST